MKSLIGRSDEVFAYPMRRVLDRRLQHRRFFGSLVIGLTLLCSWIAPAPGLEIQVPKGQPAQIRSEVAYRSKWTDAFFTSDQWSYPWWIIKDPDGHIENTQGGPTDEKALPHLKHTARCHTAHQGEHEINFCDAVSRGDDTLLLYLHDESASTFDNLLLVVHAGSFTSQYWTAYIADRGDEGLVWRTTRQKLVLDKKANRKGDRIRGEVDFECVQEVTNPKYGGKHPTTIRVQGIFKPILQ